MERIFKSVYVEVYRDGDGITVTPKAEWMMKTNEAKDYINSLIVDLQKARDLIE